MLTICTCRYIICIYLHLTCPCTTARQPGVCNVKVIHNDPVTQQQISVWEKAMGCTLPFDLQQFYMSHDGGLLSWQYLYNSEFHSFISQITIVYIPG